MDLQISYQRIRNQVFIQSGNFFALSWLFLISVLFFRLKLSDFTMGMVYYISVLLSSGTLGLIAACTKRKIVSEVYRVTIILSMLSNILLCALCTFLFIDILVKGNENCNNLTEGECNGISLYLFVVMIVLYIGISISIIGFTVKAFAKCSYFVKILSRRNIVLEALN